MGHGRAWLYLKGIGKPAKGSMYGSRAISGIRKVGGGGEEGSLLDLLFHF